jgi:predicted TIM-barrel fold metal-dependent hydrolase
MAAADKAIVFPLHYGDSAGIESDDETCADCVAKYPDKFVGFAYIDPRHSDCMELLEHAVEDLGLRGVKFGPIYNGVALCDPRLKPVYRYCVKHDLPLTMHMGTTFARNAPVELGRAIHAEPIALEFPDLRNVNAVVDGTGLPRVSQDVIEGIVHSNPFQHWWHQPIRF